MRSRPIPQISYLALRALLYRRMSLEKLDQAIKRTPYQALEEANSHFEQCHLCNRRQPLDIMTIKVDTTNILDKSNPDNGVYVCDNCTAE